VMRRELLCHGFTRIFTDQPVVEMQINKCLTRSSAASVQFGKIHRNK
jgi:hypothetical protein